MPITDYAEKMNLNVEKLKQWIKEYKEPLPYGAISLSGLVEMPSRKSSFKFETETIKVDTDKELLQKALELMAMISKC